MRGEWGKDLNLKVRKEELECTMKWGKELERTMKWGEELKEATDR